MPGYVNDSGNLDPAGTPFTEDGTDPGNYATYDGDGGTDGIGSPYYRTTFGEWENSESPYGTSDQGGNVWEWYDTVDGSPRGLRGGSYYNYDTDLRAARRYPVSHPGDDDPDVGFRVAEVGIPQPPPIPAVSEWGMVTMALLVLTAGSLVWARRRVSFVAR